MTTENWIELSWYYYYSRVIHFLELALALSLSNCLSTESHQQQLARNLASFLLSKLQHQSSQITSHPIPVSRRLSDSPTILHNDRVSVNYYYLLLLSQGKERKGTKCQICLLLVMRSRWQMFPLVRLQPKPLFTTYPQLIKTTRVWWNQQRVICHLSE